MRDCQFTFRNLFHSQCDYSFIGCEKCFIPFGLFGRSGEGLFRLMFILFLCVWINQLFCRKRNINSALYWEAEWCVLAAIQICLLGRTITLCTHDKCYLFGHICLFLFFLNWFNCISKSCSLDWQPKNPMSEGSAKKVLMFQSP